MRRHLMAYINPSRSHFNKILYTFSLSEFHGAAVEHAVVARLIMSRSGARNLQTALSQLASRMPQDGGTATATAGVTPAPISATPTDSVNERAAHTRSRNKKKS